MDGAEGSGSGDASVGATVVSCAGCSVEAGFDVSGSVAEGVVS